MVLGFPGGGWGFPRVRPRRLRFSGAIRDLVAETSVEPSHLMLPFFVDERLARPVPSNALPGVIVYPPEHESLVQLVSRALDNKVKSFLVFGIPSRKDSEASRAWSKDGPVQRALRYLRREIGWEPLIATDLCICGYTDHGHCGVPRDTRRGKAIDNDSTLGIYRKIAVSQAEAGSDLIAPSGMMDGQVAAIREALDSEGYSDVGILAYTAKYASSFYGPFRGVMDSAPRFGDRRSYQMDPRNKYEALKEAMLDVQEGADIIMVKPALAYLDVISLLKQHIPWVPLAAYSVSGEYLMIEAAAEKGYIDRDSILLEILGSIRRAGADIIITYHALTAAEILNG